ncbi:chromosomal replication initiator protein DnaA [Dethiosulfatarculus sandiegensis]|uniref:Chromosomal replication initiator protein DnaA n=1 Tax=Dethiosulfatarculus sandiegensis TaxID=1429043 RepID=A0A0D2HP11_9BACT|nr:chromosomal replication initiator protein DnaA [Dethiosulfatarculus sandiegensis]KIX12283.1 hypothetical protein X474_19975 [Dethiosulfatarculus sandiegensis]
MSENRLWNHIIEDLQNRLERDDFDLWIKPLAAQMGANDNLTLLCPSRFHLKRLRETYLPMVNNFLENQGEQVKLNCKVAVPSNSRGENQSNRQMNLPSIKRGMPLLNNRFKFDRFVAGGGNELAFAAAKALAGEKRFFSNTLLLVSDTGLGKSHLTQSVGHYVMETQPNARVAYLTAEDFANQMISALRRKNMDAFKEHFRRECDILLLEEIPFLAGKEKTQDELGFTLDALLDAGKRIILTSCQVPNEIKGIKRNLESRISSGMTINIEPPDHRTRVNILAHQAHEEGMVVDPEVLEYLAQEIPEDIRRLQSSLVGIMAQGSLTNRPMDLGLAVEIVGKMTHRKKKVNVETIRDMVARIYGMEISTLTSRSRRKVVTVPRNMAMYLCRKHTSASYATIGRSFNRDHATVMYGVNQIDRKIANDPKLQKEMSHIEQRLGVR